jgi:putative tryptophan/tyrosine transport system substrate-binding protein
MALLVNPTSPDLAEADSREQQKAARTLGLQLHVLHASTEGDFDEVFASLVQLRASGLVIGTDSFFNTEKEHLAALTVHHGMPIRRISSPRLKSAIPSRRHRVGRLNCALD